MYSVGRIARVSFVVDFRDQIARRYHYYYYRSEMDGRASETLVYIYIHVHVVGSQICRPRELQTTLYSFVRDGSPSTRKLRANINTTSSCARDNITRIIICIHYNIVSLVHGNCLYALYVC